MGSRWDGILGGIKFRILRLDSEPGYRRGFDKPPLEDPYITPGRDSGISPRMDMRTVMFDSWSQGYLWAEPRFGENTRGGYSDCISLSLTAVPGAIAQGNSIDIDSPGDANLGDGPIVVGDPGTGVLAPYRCFEHDMLQVLVEGVGDLWYWDDVIDIGDDVDTLDLYFWDSTIYRLDTNGKVSFYSDPTATANHWTGLSVYPGAALVSGLELGDVLLYTGEKLVRLEYTGPTTSDITDDGHGPDALNSITVNGLAHHPRLAVATSEGIWYVKNVLTSGSVVPWVYRVERDGAGNIISQPIATLPSGTIATSIGWHMGTPLIVVTPMSPTGSSTVYALIAGNVGVVGSFPPEARVYTFLFSTGETAYFGGGDCLYEYDAVRGGMHPGLPAGAHTAAPIPSPNRPHEQFVYNTTSVSGVGQRGRGAITDFGSIESLPFDFDLPFHEKSITKAFIWMNYTPSPADFTWTLEVRADADSASGWGAWEEVGQYDPNTQKFVQTTLTTPVVGTRFQWKLTCDNNGGTQYGEVTALGFEATINTVREVYNLRIDATEFINVEGEPQDPDEVYDAWAALGATGEPVAFKDLFQHYEHESDSEISDKMVKIETITIDKQDPGEAFIRVAMVVV